MKKLLAAFLTVTLAVAAPMAAMAGSASLVLDARTGKILSSENGDTLNYPASLTKMMTLYLTFEALHRGKISWNTKVRFSRNASSKPPTKLWVKPGQSITVREAVLGMIVQSANDAAAAMGEKLAGSESAFARMMTAKARQLGMTRTVFANASGLPNKRQVTTARDMSTLAVALMKNYPKEYRLFSTASFKFRGRTIRGHNNLMYRYKGMDGIKTGYTNASGFNIVSAVKDGNRRVVGVVLGGRTARSRDAKMAALLDRYVARASSSGAWLVASVDARETVEVASAALASDVPVPLSAPRPAEEVAEAPRALGYVESAVVPMERPAAMEEIINAGKPAAAGWQIQISAAPSADAARALLARARSDAGGPLRDASPYTEAVGEGAGKLYRARFVGFDSREAAASACDALKRHSYDCMLLQNRG
jgi:D-alanyl-D-alanine carboxypeptidase (penicillin-binding protein 5/6)